MRSTASTMMIVASPAMSLTKHSIAVDFPSPGGPDSKSPRFMLNPSAFSMSRLRIEAAMKSSSARACSCGMMSFHDRPDMRERTVRRSRLTSTMRSLKGFDSWRASHKRDDGGFVLFAVDEPNAVTQLARSEVSLHDEHKVSVAFRHSAAKNGARADHLQLAVHVEHHFVRAHAWQDYATLSIAKTGEFAQPHPARHIGKLLRQECNGRIVAGNEIVLGSLPLQRSETASNN